MRGIQGVIATIAIATEVNDIAAESNTSLNAKTYDTKLGYTGAITFGSNWCYFSQIDKVIKTNDFEESATDWIDS